MTERGRSPVDMLKDMAGDFLRSQMPQPKGDAEAVCITPEGVLRQIQSALEHGTDPDEPIRLALLLAAILASQQGWDEKRAIKQAGAAWLGGHLSSNSPKSLLEQLEAAIECGTDPQETIRLSTLLGAAWAKERRWRWTDCVMQAGLAWTQTRGLRKP